MVLPNSLVIDGIITKTKKLIMYSDNISIEERIDAGKTYLELGGNGSGAVYYETLKSEYKELLKK
jgi:hypothetical protein